MKCTHLDENWYYLIGKNLVIIQSHSGNWLPRLTIHLIFHKKQHVVVTEKARKKRNISCCIREQAGRSPALATVDNGKGSHLLQWHL